MNTNQPHNPQFNAATQFWNPTSDFDGVPGRGAGIDCATALQGG
jgi:hypothetical protein